MNKEITYIGLGRMGLGMVQNLSDQGWTVHAFDVSEDARKVAEEAGASVYESAHAAVAAHNGLTWVMVPHQYVDDVLTEIGPALSAGNIVIDGGNSPYQQSINRYNMFVESGVHYIDAGISGGPEGARHGACAMVGGDKAVFDSIEELFRDISAPDAYKYLGRTGAGHFVKMVHNGIEYGMMEAIAEGFHVMKKSDFDLSMIDVADVYQHESVVTSRLIGWLQDGFKQYGEDLDEVSGSAGASGEGEWTIKAAKELGIDVHSMEHALDARHESQKNPGYGGKLIQTMRNMFGGHAGRTNISG